MLTSIGTTEILIILLVVLVLFGSNRLPGVIKSAYKGWRDIQNATQGVKDELNNILEDDSELSG